MKTRTLLIIAATIILVVWAVVPDRSVGAHNEAALRALPQTIVSVPVITPQLDLLRFSDRQYAFGSTVNGRPLRYVRWFALERSFFYFRGDRLHRYTFDELSIMEEEGRLHGLDEVIIGFDYALARGDSTAVAQLIANDAVRWQVSAPEDSFPKVRIGNWEDFSCPNVASYLEGRLP